MLETQARMVELECIREENPGGVVVVFSHGDVIRAAVMHLRGYSARPLPAHRNPSSPGEHDRTACKQPAYHPAE